MELLCKIAVTLMFIGVFFVTLIPAYLCVTILLIEPVWYIIAMFSLPLIGYVLWVFVICFREVKELWEG